MISSPVTAFNLESLGGPVACLHHIVERLDGIRQVAQENLILSRFSLSLL
jgi:hypothetical protein